MYPTREEERIIKKQKEEFQELEEELFGIDENIPRLSDEEYFKYISHNAFEEMRNY